jgi:hypothetical protein
MRIARALPSKPQDFLPIDLTLFFCRKSGILAPLCNDSSVASYWKVCKTSIHQVVASTIITHHRKVFLVNLATHTVKSLLKQSLESLSASTMQLSISMLREFVAVLIDTSILTIYQIHNDEAELLKIEFIEGNGKIVGVFSETSREFWVLDRGFCGQKFLIQPGDPDPFYCSRLCRLCRGSKFGAPTVCECACNKLLVGTDTGNLVAYDWFGELPVTCGTSHKPITALSLSPDHTLCLVSETDGEVCVVNVESFEAKRFARKSVKVKFISPIALLEDSGKELSHLAAADSKL